MRIGNPWGKTIKFGCLFHIVEFVVNGANVVIRQLVIGDRFESQFIMAFGLFQIAFQLQQAPKIHVRVCAG